MLNADDSFFHHHLTGAQVGGIIGGLGDENFFEKC
jgi:hypothetical protein